MYLEAGPFPHTSDAPAYKVPKWTLKVQIPFELMKTSSLFNTTNNVWYDFVQRKNFAREDGILQCSLKTSP